MRSWVISIQSLTPISEPAADLISSKPLKIRISASRALELHFRDVVRNDEVGRRQRHHLTDADARGPLKQGRLAVGETDDGHIGHDEVHRPDRCQRQTASRDYL